MRFPMRSGTAAGGALALSTGCVGTSVSSAACETEVNASSTTCSATIASRFIVCGGARRGSAVQLHTLDIISGRCRGRADQDHGPDRSSDFSISRSRAGPVCSGAGSGAGSGGRQRGYGLRYARDLRQYSACRRPVSWVFLGNMAIPLFPAQQRSRSSLRYFSSAASGANAAAAVRHRCLLVLLRCDWLC